ncbi:MAG: hypothetical protein FJZ04_03370 [Candidatus Moranbacteria bacterium]|nr:hypothetical protein [Candidatus Moranbacteria bacterium]
MDYEKEAEQKLLIEEETTNLTKRINEGIQALQKIPGDEKTLNALKNLIVLQKNLENPRIKNKIAFHNHLLDKIGNMSTIIGGMVKRLEKISQVPAKRDQMPIIKETIEKYIETLNEYLNKLKFETDLMDKEIGTSWEENQKVA